MTMMKAAVIHEAGGPDVLKLESRPVPTPQPGEVLIRVKAFGLNRSELFTRQGLSPDVKFPRILGIEAAGVVEAAPGTKFAKGDIVATVMGGMGRMFDGSYAEYTCVPAGQVQRIKTQLPWETLGARDLTHLARGKKVVYADRVSGPQFASSLGSVFGYLVRSLTRGFRGRAILSETSNRASAMLLDVSGPVLELKVVTTEKALRLDWAAPSRTLTGSPVEHLAGYHVYRSEKPKLESFSAVGESNSAAFSYPHFEFGRTYRYKVRAVFKQGAQEAEGEDSDAYQVTPRDVFPPDPPQRLTALYTVGAVELIWNANLEPDLAGYRVYRREAGRPFQQINKELLPTPIYRDATVEPQRHYFYQVTAVDWSGNESKPSIAVQADTE